MKEDKNIEKMIRDSLKFEKSSEDFADKVMQKIEAADAVEEKALSSLLRRHTLESPSAGFASRVMQQIRPASTVETNPVIIGRKAWALIFAGFAALIGYILMAPANAQPEPGPYADLTEKIGNWFGQLGGSVSLPLPEILTNPVFAISLFALSSLLFLDYVIKNRSLSTI